MRILTVGNMYPPHHYGGYEIVWAAAVDHLRAQGHDVHVLTTDTRTSERSDDPPWVARELRWALRDGAFLPLAPRQRLRLARHNHGILREALARIQPEVVAWFAMGGLTLTMLETVRRRAIPAVAFVHDDWLGYGPWVDGWLRTFTGPRRGPAGRLLEPLLDLPTRVAFDAAADYVFVSDFTRRHSGLGPAARTGVAHSGIHASFLEPAPEQPWEWRLLYVGRLDPRKGVETAVAALTHLPEASLRILGGWDSAEAGRLRALSQTLGVTHRVRFDGHADRAAVHRAYGEADAALFPVEWDEPWGLVPLEAMGRGRPVLATGRGGSAEYLRDGVNHLHVPAGDPSALADGVRRLAEDPALRRRLRDGGQVTAPKHTEAGFNAAVEDWLRRAVAHPAR